MDSSCLVFSLMPISNLMNLVSKTLCLCSQRMYLLKQLKSQGLGIKQLHIVFTALIVSRVIYTLPAWGGFLSSDLLNKIDSILRKAHNKPISLAILPRSSRLRIYCKMQIINSFHLRSDLLTAFIHYFPTSK